MIGGFRDKLVAERAALRGTGLVWVGDADLDRFYRGRHPRITAQRPHARRRGRRCRTQLPGLNGFLAVDHAGDRLYGVGRVHEASDRQFIVRWEVDRFVREW